MRGRCATWLALGLALAAGGCLETAIGMNEGSPIHSADVDAIVGECQGAPPGASSVRQGMAQCDLVRLQGRPKDAVIAEMPDGRRRVELFYPGNGGTTRGYVFIADRLVSTPPGTLKE